MGNLNTLRPNWRLKQLFLLLILGWGACYRLSATHIVGGEITYQCLGNQQYRITLTVYRDCFNGLPWFDNPAALGIYDAEWRLRTNVPLTLNRSSNDTIPVILTNPCLSLPPGVCVHRTSYTTTVTLPFSPGGYTVVYQRCCRNRLIRNLPDPLNTGISITTQISEQSLQACNTSAVFRNWPPVAICVQEPIRFDHSATDADGDSLVYRLCTPLAGPDSITPQPRPPFRGPYPPVVWRPPYSEADMLGGEPLRIDANTGLLTGTPNRIGNFVVGICVDEYRSGKLLSSTRRDFQYNVADCGRPEAVFLAPQSLCGTREVQLRNQGTPNRPYRWYFDWDRGRQQTSTLFSPRYTFPDTGLFQVALIINPGGTCSDTAVQTIRVTQFAVKASAQYSFGRCDDNGVQIVTTDRSTDPLYGIRSWQWTLRDNTGGVLAQSNAPATIMNTIFSGDVNLSLVVTSNNGCMDTTRFQFKSPFPPVSRLVGQRTLCEGDTIGLFPDADPTLRYQWEPAAGLSGVTLPNPTASPKNSTVYNVTISNNTCTQRKTVAVTVVESGKIQAFAAPPRIYRGEKTQLTAIAAGATAFSWTPVAGLSNANSAITTAMPNDSTTYLVKATLVNGCVLRATVRVGVLSPICDEPFLFFPTGFTPNDDGQNDMLRLEGRFLTEVYWVIYNRWGEKVFEATDPEHFWDGTFRGQPAPMETYGYYLRVRCPDGSTKIKKGNVTLLR
jgi:gliding motility-associated-like protein